MRWNQSKVLKKLFLETTDWNVAWKKEDSIEYTIINNPDGYWFADSLIFSCENGVFLFVEAFDKKEKIGKLAVLKYNGETFSDFKIIMEKNYHLSYPYVFEYKKEYYMIPETSGNNCIEIYKAINFPYEWEKQKELIKGPYVDTTIFEYDKKMQFYTYDIKNNYLINGILNMDNLNLENINSQIDDDYNHRAGGNVYVKDGLYLRAIQNNKYFYNTIHVRINWQ